jgi:hypothetical protein
MSRSVYLHKVLAKVLIAAVLLLSPPAVTAKNVPKATTKSEPKATTPICSIKCPEGYRAALFTWELHPERTGYDETGVEIVPADGVWKVSCAARCELKVEGEPTKVTTEKKEVCDSGGEPGPFTGPWRITGKWVRGVRGDLRRWLRSALLSDQNQEAATTAQEEARRQREKEVDCMTNIAAPAQ